MSPVHGNALSGARPSSQFAFWNQFPIFVENNGFLMRRYRIALAAALFLIGFSAHAKYDFEVGGIYYKVLSLENMTCMVVDNNGNDDKYFERDFQPSCYSGEIEIPSTVVFKGRKLRVMEIGNGAFYKSDVSYVTLGKGIIEIGRYAFANCIALDHVELPKSLWTIRQYAFYNCYGFTVITIPASCTTIEERAFDCLYGFFRRILFLEDGDSVLFVEQYGLGHRTKEDFDFASVHIGRKIFWLSGSENVFFNEYDSISTGLSIEDIHACTYGSSYNRVTSLIISPSVKKIGDLTKVGFDESIGDIIVYSITPPKATGFSNSAYINVTLKVPEESIQLYASDPVWKKFWTIEAIPNYKDSFISEVYRYFYNTDIEEERLVVENAVKTVEALEAAKVEAAATEATDSGGN